MTDVGVEVTDRAKKGAIGRLIVTVLMALGLAGCFGPALRDGPAAVPRAPDVWQAALDATRPLPENWLDTFEDDHLKALVAEAQLYNNTILETAARYDAAVEAARASGAVLVPSIDATADGGRFRSSFENGAGPDNAASSSLSVGLQASWELDLWGRLRNRVNAARADARASEADLEAIELSIAGQTAIAWFNLLEARLQRELSERDVDNRERTLNIITRRYIRGVSESLDLRLARSDLAGRRAVLASSRQAEEEAARALEILLGRYPLTAVRKVEALPPLPALDGKGLPVEILTRRPDLLAAEERLLAAGLRAREARKALLPRLTLTGSINASDSSIGELFDAERIAGNIIGGLLQPVFRGGQLRATARQQRALAEAALYRYVDTALRAYLEVENALRAESYLAEREAALIVSFEEAVGAEDLTLRDYSQGLTSIFNLLDSKSRRISAEGALISVRRARLVNRVNLHLAVGGSFSADGITPARLIETRS